MPSEGPAAWAPIPEHDPRGAGQRALFPRVALASQPWCDWHLGQPHLLGIVAEAILTLIQGSSGQGLSLQHPAFRGRSFSPVKGVQK